MNQPLGVELRVMARRTIQVWGNARNGQERANMFTPVSGPGNVPSGYDESQGGQSPRPTAMANANIPQTPMMSVRERREHYRQDLRERRTQSSPAFLNSVARNNLMRDAGRAAATAGRNPSAAASEAGLAMREQQLGVDTRQDQYRQSADQRANTLANADANRMTGQGDAYRGQGKMFEAEGREADSRGRYNDALSQYQVPAQARELDARSGLYNAQARDIPEAAQDRRSEVGARGRALDAEGAARQQDAATRSTLGQAQAGQIQAETQQIGPNSAAMRGRMAAETAVGNATATAAGQPTLLDTVEAEERRVALRDKYPQQYPQTPVPMGGGTAPAGIYSGGRPQQQQPEASGGFMGYSEQEIAEAAKLRGMTIEEVKRAIQARAGTAQ